LPLVLDGLGSVTVDPNAIDDGSSDACGTPSLSVAPASFDCSNIGNQSVVLTLTDGSGNTSSCTATVDVQDNAAPTADCNDFPVSLDASGSATILLSDVNGSTSDNCPSNLNFSFAPNTFTCSEVGPNTVLLTVTDASSNVGTCESIVTVLDDEDPVATCKTATVQLDGSGSGTVTSDQVNLGSSDNCGFTLTVTPNTFDCTDLGTNNVVVVATDPSGNTDNCIAAVIVEDNVTPTASCLTTMPVLNLGPLGTVDVTFGDIDDGSVLGCAETFVTPTSFGCTEVGTQTVTLELKYGTTVVGSCTSDISVVDAIAPTAECSDLTVSLDGAGNAAISVADVEDGTASSDNCNISSQVLDISAFTCANLGANTVTHTVTDVNGNSAACTSSVTIIDDTAPTVNCPSGPVVAVLVGNSVSVDVPTMLSPSDNCGSPNLQVTSITTFDCSHVGLNTVNTVTSDASNNATICTFDVDVQDNTLPTAVCQDITVSLDATGNASIEASDVDNGSSDNCGFTMAIAPSSFTCADHGTTTPVTLTVTDASNNQTDCVSNVTVVDDSAPDSRYCNTGLPLVLKVRGGVDARLFRGPLLVTDNCDLDPTVTFTGQRDFGCDQLGIQSTTVDLVDANGNAVSCVITLEVIDAERPVAICKNITITLKANGTRAINAQDDFDDGSTDNCQSLLTYEVRPKLYDCTDLGVNNARLIVTDPGGRQSRAYCTVTVTDPLNACGGPRTSPEAITGADAVKDGETNGELTSIDQITELIAYPNPFSTETTIQYELNKSGNVKVQVFDLYGQMVGELVNEFQSAGTQRIVWIPDARHHEGLLHIVVTSDNDDRKVLRLERMR
jgi:hypothetical protein